MSESEGEPDPELIEQVKDIHEKKDQVVGEANEQHNALLEAAAEGEELVTQEYDTAEIGNAELTVKTEIKGEVMRQLDTVFDGEQPPGLMLDTYVDVLTEQTVEIQAGDISVESDPDIRLFWRDFLDSNDVEKAAMLAIERVIQEPLELEQERRSEAVRGFRPKG